MGKTIIPKYAVKAICIDFDQRCKKTDVFAWKGKPTLKRLKEWREAMNNSLYTHNSHLNQSAWSKCWIETNDSDHIVIVEFNPPLFEVI